jgi:hypothetical protein
MFVHDMLTMNPVLLGMSLNQSCIAHYPYDNEGQTLLGSVLCTVSPGISTMPIKPQFLDEHQRFVSSLKQEMRALFLALPSKTITIEVNEPRSSSGDMFPGFAAIMAVLGAIGAIPKDQVETVFFDALVKDGDLNHSSSNPLTAAVMAAEYGFDYWGSSTSSGMVGLVGNGCSYTASSLVDVIDHVRGRRLTKPVEQEVADFNQIANLTNIQVTTTQVGTVPVFEVGGIACTFRNGQIFTLQLDRYQDF